MSRSIYCRLRGAFCESWSPICAGYITLVNSDYTTTINFCYFSQGNQPQPPSLAWLKLDWRWTSARLELVTFNVLSWCSEIVWHLGTKVHMITWLCVTEDDVHPVIMYPSLIAGRNLTLLGPKLNWASNVSVHFLFNPSSPPHTRKHTQSLKWTTSWVSIPPPPH